MGSEHSTVNFNVNVGGKPSSFTGDDFRKNRQDKDDTKSSGAKEDETYGKSDNQGGGGA